MEKNPLNSCWLNHEIAAHKIYYVYQKWNLKRILFQWICFVWVVPTHDLTFTKYGHQTCSIIYACQWNLNKMTSM